MGFSYYTTLTIGTKFTWDDIKEKHQKQILEYFGYEKEEMGESEYYSLHSEIEDIFDLKITCTSHILCEKVYYHISVLGENHRDCDACNDENSENAKTWLMSGTFINTMDVDYEKLTLTDEQKKLIKDATFKLTGKDIPIKLHVLTSGG